STSASLTFSDSESGVSFLCQLDGGGFAACTSPKSYSGLGDGSHTFQVKARDAAGNDSALASRTWTVDTTSPVVTLTSPANGSSTSNTTPTFSGTGGTVAGDSATVTVRVYSGSSATGTPVETLAATVQAGGSYAVNASPGLAGGTYTAQAEQTDAAGNVGRSAANTFTITQAVTDPSIVAAGDIACDPASGLFNNGLGTTTACRQKYTSDLFANSNVAGVLPVGDLQYECGGYSAFLGSYDPTWGRAKSITHPVPGNREYKPTYAGGTDCDGVGQATGYFQYFGAAAGQAGKGYYSYDIGTWHLIALNSNCASVGGCGVGSAQETWLKNDLAAHTNRCTLAYWHHPRFSSGGNGNDSTYQQFWQDLYDANADVVLAGHDHDYERFAPQTPTGTADPARGLREFVVGMGGEDFSGFFTIRANSEVRQNTIFGVLKLTLHSTSYDWQFLPEAGKTFNDSGSTACH
ncbi:MAG TPA: Ig-like domain-containing protein, partial [Gaiellaceae bacterium]|nr:Ig-like domain-containing protein [Gaiellaceae bacterium]